MNFLRLILLVLLATLGAAAQSNSVETNLPAASTETAAAGTNRLATPTNAAAVADKTSPATDTNHHSSDFLKGLLLRTGLRLQLAAREPAVINPVAMAFDAKGRLLVAEQHEPSGSGRIKLLEDADGDGVFEKSEVYAELVESPTAIVCYSDGVFVASGKQILFLQDSKGDGKADVRREVFAGFKAMPGFREPRISHLVWGLDNRIHAACEGLGGDIVCMTMQTALPLSISGYDFMFNPRTLEMQIEAGGDTSGMSFDTAGRRYTSSAGDFIQFTLTQPWLAEQNPLYQWPRLSVSLNVPNGNLYPLRAATSAESAGADVIGSRYATNQYANPSSLLIYRGGALPKGFEQNIFVTDPELRLISCLQPGGNGIVPVLARHPNDRTTEFLATRDPTFRPVQIIAAPDGTLCIADLARTNANVFDERGRIWRLTPQTYTPVRSPDLKALDTPALMELLGNGNGWVQDTAARLLFERANPALLSAADKQFRSTWNPAIKLRLLELLAANNALSGNTLMRALQDKDDSVRERAVQLVPRYVQNGELPAELLARLSLNAKDVSPRVRFHLAVGLAGVQHPAVPSMLASALLMSPDDALLQTAVLTGAHTDAGGVMLNLVGHPSMRRTSAHWALLRQLAAMAGTQGYLDVNTLFVRLNSSGLSDVDQLTLAADVGEGLFANGRTFFGGATTNQWRDFGGRVLRVAIGNGAPALRAEALRFLGVSGFTMEEAGDWMVALLVPGEPLEVQLASVRALSHLPDPAVTTAFVQRWPRLSLPVQREIIAKMLEQFDRTQALVEAIELGLIPPGALTDVQVNFLRAHRDPTTAARAKRIYGPLLIPQTKPDFSAILKLKGSAQRGLAIYQQRCAGCHRFGKLGQEIGPRLDTLAEHSEESLLSDILEPNREIDPEFKTQVLQRSNNQLLYGLVRKTGNNFVEIQTTDGRRLVLPQTQVEDTFPQEWSLMPLNAAVGLTAKDIANLVAFLKSGSAAQ